MPVPDDRDTHQGCVCGDCPSYPGNAPGPAAPAASATARISAPMAATPPYSRSRPAWFSTTPIFTGTSSARTCSWTRPCAVHGAEWGPVCRGQHTPLHKRRRAVRGFQIERRQPGDGGHQRPGGHLPKGHGYGQAVRCSTGSQGCRGQKRAAPPSAPTAVTWPSSRSPQTRFPGIPTVRVMFCAR